MHFQLFLPGRRGCAPALLEEVGLADFVAGAEFIDSGDGPGSPGETGRGVVVAWRKPGSVQMGYRANEQTWLPAAPRASEDLAGGRYWVGLWNMAPTLPRDLARPYPQPGSTVALGDGNDWILPNAKELDADMILADDGSWRFEPQRRFHAFNLEYLRWMQFFGNAKPEDQFVFADGAEFILQALRINYRMLPEVASHLRLFSKETVLKAMFAAMGIDRG